MNDKISVEDGFRESLKDVVTICEKLSASCQSTSDLTEMLKLALENDGQLRLILSMMTPQSKR